MTSFSRLNIPTFLAPRIEPMRFTPIASSFSSFPRPSFSPQLPQHNFFEHRNVSFDQRSWSGYYNPPFSYSPTYRYDNSSDWQPRLFTSVAMTESVRQKRGRAGEWKIRSYSDCDWKYETKFFTPIHFEVPNKTRMEVILEYVDSYFYVRGERACVLNKEPFRGHRLIEEKVPVHSCFFYIVSAIKIATYVTIVIPLFMLVTKAFLRTCYFWNRSFAIAKRASHIQRSKIPRVFPPRNIPQESNLLARIPDELLLSVFSFLSPIDLKPMLETNISYYQFLSSPLQEKSHFSFPSRLIITHHSQLGNSSPMKTYVRGVDFIVSLNDDGSRTLREVNLSEGRPGASLLEYISKIPTLHTLRMQDINITDQRFLFITKLTDLQSIVLDDLRDITDAILDQLKNLKKLNSLTIIGCSKITDAAINSFREARPDIDVVHAYHSDSSRSAGLSSTPTHDYSEFLFSHLIRPSPRPIILPELFISPKPISSPPKRHFDHSFNMSPAESARRQRDRELMMFSLFLMDDEGRTPRDDSPYDDSPLYAGTQRMLFEHLLTSDRSHRVDQWFRRAFNRPTSTSLSQNRPARKLLVVNKLPRNSSKSGEVIEERLLIDLSEFGRSLISSSLWGHFQPDQGLQELRL